MWNKRRREERWKKKVERETQEKKTKK